MGLRLRRSSSTAYFLSRENQTIQLEDVPDSGARDGSHDVVIVSTSVPSWAAPACARLTIRVRSQRSLSGRATVLRAGQIVERLIDRRRRWIG